MANEWYLTDVPKIMSEADLLYRRITEKAPDKTKESVTVQRIVEARKWGPSLPLYASRFEAAVRQLGCFYVPKVIVPGPAFVFPMRSANGTYPRAQTKPLEGSVLMMEGMKYRYVGDKNRFIGPNWLGNDLDTLRLIVEKRMAMCVEGAFDLLAVRLMCPGYPILSPLTKRLGKHHIAYLRILGVNRLILMYDREQQGEEAMEQQIRQMNGIINASSATCPQKDPSMALERLNWANGLYSTVSQSFEY
jgi:hypothetical protein